MLECIGSKVKVKVKDQKMWTEVVKENTTSDGELALVLGRRGTFLNRSPGDMGSRQSTLWMYCVSGICSGT